jgi:hypothetical protein
VATPDERPDRGGRDAVQDTLQTTRLVIAAVRPRRVRGGQPIALCPGAQRLAFDRR